MAGVSLATLSSVGAAVTWVVDDLDCSSESLAPRPQPAISPIAIVAVNTNDTIFFTLIVNLHFFDSASTIASPYAVV